MELFSFSNDGSQAVRTDKVEAAFKYEETGICYMSIQVNGNHYPSKAYLTGKERDEDYDRLIQELVLIRGA